MNCVICRGAEIEVANVQEELRVGNDVVYVPVEAHVCRACGERYYDRRAMRYLEEVEEKLRQGTAELQEVGKVLVYR